MIAFESDSSTCLSCSGRRECVAEINSRRIGFLKHLASFSDGKGESMAFYWLSKDEKRIIRNKRAALANTTKKTKSNNRSEADVIIDALKDRPHTMSELIVEVGQRCSLSASTARRKTYEAVKTLLTENRLKSNSQLLEIV